MSEAEGPFFLDSNILIYAFDTAEPAKRTRSRALIESLPRSAIVLSAQEAVRGLAGFRILPLDYRLSIAAMALVRKHHVSIWNALNVTNPFSG